MAFERIKALIGRMNPYILSDIIKDSSDLDAYQKRQLLDELVTANSQASTSSLWEKHLQRTRLAN